MSENPNKQANIGYIPPHRRQYTPQNPQTLSEPSTPTPRETITKTPPSSSPAPQNSPTPKLQSPSLQSRRSQPPTLVSCDLPCTVQSWSRLTFPTEIEQSQFDYLWDLYEKENDACSVPRQPQRSQFVSSEFDFPELGSSPSPVSTPKQTPPSQSVQYDTSLTVQQAILRYLGSSFDHILELTGFDKNFDSNALDKVMNYQPSPYYVKWTGQSQLLLVFENSSLAHAALTQFPSKQSPTPLSLHSSSSFTQPSIDVLLMPPLRFPPSRRIRREGARGRPKSDATVANRTILNTLGIRIPKKTP
ncbi:hypothetical protein BLNAU_19562 [Blattamonas nauphoetae]|uniref:Uncharacterized protein n=1 Tax=Blattamonas nauphoetae TaxID=2049346 RepID=A0ABQ9X2A9_9EUKA|nr:hypothetical protein BLNAU_19562 [Blattamonas nauphoetae]